MPGAFVGVGAGTRGAGGGNFQTVWWKNQGPVIWRTNSELWPTAPAITFSGAYASFVFHPYFMRTDADQLCWPGIGDPIRWIYVLGLNAWFEQWPSNPELRPTLGYDAGGFHSESRVIGQRFVIQLGKNLVSPLTMGVRYQLTDNTLTYSCVFGGQSPGNGAIVGPWSSFASAGLHMAGGWRSLNAWDGFGDLNKNTVIGTSVMGVDGSVYLNGAGGYAASGGANDGFGENVLIHAAFQNNNSTTAPSRVYRACLIESALDATGRSNLRTWLETPNT